MMRFVLLFSFLFLISNIYTQDTCGVASDEGSLDCGGSISGNGDSSSTPDPAESVNCMVGLDGTWFTFTTDAALSEFTISGGDYNLFEGDCSSLTLLADCGGPFDIVADATTTYYVLVNDNFSVDAPAEAANDDCSSAIDATGGISGQSNLCASPDNGLCGSDGDASVWFTISIDQDLSIFEVNLTSQGITDAVIALYSDCSTQLVEECGESLSTTCIAAGTYFIQVGSDFSNVGEFDLAFTETPVSVANNACENAIDITPSVVCESENVAGDSTGACPESSNFGTGCEIDIQPTIWYEISTSSASTSLDFANLSSNLELAIIDGCGGASVTGCITGDTNLPISGGTTYYIAAALTTGEGSFDFDVTMNEPPENDPCDSAIVLELGEGQNTCCGSIEGTDACGGSETGVWFVIPGPDGDGTIFDFSNIDMSGNIGIEIYSGACGGLVLLNEPYCGGAGNYGFETANCGVDAMYIHVTSSADGCGSFDMSSSPALACAFGEDCGDGPSLAPATGSGEDCADGCTTYSCDSECGSSGGVWFEVTTDELATEMTVVVNDVGSGNIDPVISVYEDECGGSQVLGCVGSPSGNITEFAVNGNLTYYIEVSTGGGGTPGDFELCVSTDESEQECSSGDLEPTRPEYPDADPTGPYCPGEVVNFCYSVTFTVDPGGQGNNCQWIQGIIPTIGGGWDLDIMPLDIQGPGGSWFWLPEEEVAYQAPSSALGLIDTPNGLGLEFGPGSLSDGDLLPGGWWATSDGGGANCTNDGNPNTMWGLPASCGSTQDIEFCFDLQVGFLDDISQCDDEDYTDLKVHMFTMADGQTGCWSNNSCSGDTPVTFNAILDCTSLVFILGEDQEICSNDVLNIPLESEDGSPVDIIVTVIEEGNTSGAMDHEFPGGMGTIADQIENEGGEIEVVIYEAYALDPNSICEGPRTEIEVIVYPVVEIEVEDPYYICYQDPREITPVVEGGSGGPYEYEWEDGSDDPSIVLPMDPDLLPGLYEIVLTVTDNFGCSNSKVIEYEIVEPLIPVIINPTPAVCKDGTLDLAQLELEFESVGTGPYEYLWMSNPGGLEIEGGTDEAILIINEEESSSRTYTIFGTVIDDYGCEYTTETEFNVDNGPDMVLEIEECFGTAFNLVGYDRDGLPVTFELFYDVEGDWIYDGTTILNAESVAQSFGDNITYLAEEYGTYLLLGTSSNGCNDYVELEVPPVPQPQFQVLPNDTICAGTQVTINILNNNEYVNINWSTTDSGPTIIVSPDDTITYYIVAETGDDCTVTDSVRIVVNPLPEITVTGSTSICPGAETILTAQGDPTFNYLWTGPNGTMFTTQTATISTIGNWVLEVVTPAGCLTSENILIDENAQLNPDIDGENLCTGLSAILDGGPGFDTYEWLDEAGDEVGTDQTVEVFNGGTYTLNVQLGSGPSACNGSDQFTVEQFDPVPNALTALSFEVCNTLTGDILSTLNLTNFETGVTGTWFDDNNLPVVNPSLIDFTGSTPGIYIYSFVTNQAQAPCTDDTYEFNILVTDCTCPSLAIGIPPDYCNEPDTFDLNLIQITTELGSWSISPSGMEITDNLLISSEATAAGIYNLTFTLEDTNQSSVCEVDSTVQFNVFQSFDAIIEQDVTVCNEDSNGPDFLDLTDLLISGDPGVWSTNEPGLDITTDNLVSFFGLDVGTYIFFYFMEDVNSPCTPVSIPVEIEVRDCSCPLLELEPIPTLCNTGGNLDLNSLLNNPENEPGIWSITGPDDSALVGTSILSDGRAEGQYEVTFTFTNMLGSSCTNSISGILEIASPPVVEIEENISVCNGTTIMVFPTEIDLTSLVSGSTGIWSAPIEYNGGVIDDITKLDFLDVDPGSYMFTFMTDSAISPCDEVSYTLMVEVRNCNCPSVNFIPPTPLCNDGPPLDLNIYLPADALAGEWSFFNGTPTVTLTNGSFVDISLLEGNYYFQYTLTEEPPMGCSPSGQILVEVVSPPDVNHVPSVDVCNTVSINGPLCINLNDFLTGAPGDWAIPSGYDGDASDISNICFDSDDVGEVLEFVFNTTTGSTTCDERNYTTTITIKDCNCPNLSLLPGPQICNDSGSFDLTSLFTPNIEAGTFELMDGPSLLSITNGQTDFTGAEAGNYTFIYVPTVLPSADCDQNGTTTIEVVDNPSVGTPAFTELCISDGEIIELEDMLLDADLGGTWSMVNPTNSFNFVDNKFTADGQEPGRYEFVYSFENVDPCPDNDVSIVLIVTPQLQPEVEDSPCANANEGAIIVASIPGTGLDFLYSIDGGLTWSEDPLFNNLAPGSYTLLIEDENGCQTSMPNIVVSEPGPFSVNAGEDRQFDENDAFITLELATSVAISDIVSIVWTEDGVEICSGGVDQCFIIQVSPDGVAEYCATVIDINNCVSEDCVILRELVVKDVYIPTVFDPTSIDNNIFFVQTDEFVESITELSIYDRWGEAVFIAEPNHAPNDKAYGWDGRFNDRDALQGVYVYVIKVKYTDGSDELFAGDITVLR